MKKYYMNSRLIHESWLEADLTGFHGIHKVKNNPDARQGETDFAHSV